MGHSRSSVRRFPWVAALLLATACSEGDFYSIGSTTGALHLDGPVAGLRVQLEVGTLRLREGDVEDVEVRADVRVREGLGEHVALAADGSLPFGDWIRLEQQGDELLLRSAVPGSDHELRLEVVVPAARRALDLRLGVGAADIDLGAVERMTVDLGVGSGTMQVGSCAGPMVAKIGTGTLQLVVSKAIDGDLDADVGVGDLVLVLPPKVPGAFNFDVSVGSIRGAETLGLQIEKSVTGASARGNRGDGGHRVHATVATGTLTLGR